MRRFYAAIDLKSFYASVECVSRGLDPLDTNLVVADRSRTEKTICLAVTPPLKARGIPGRPRLFEVTSQVEKINRDRIAAAGGVLTGKSFSDRELKENKNLLLDYIIAEPRMDLYMKTSAEINRLYADFISPEDTLVYSVDEVFLDLSGYLKTSGKTPRELTTEIVRRVYSETGITATVGIGTNMYLSKIAMDIVAKRALPDKNGARIAELDIPSYRRLLWTHFPLTDFWRVGRGTCERLNRLGIYTMGDLARFSLNESETLYSAFGVNAELLIDHAWGWEPVGIGDCKSYRPGSKSFSRGQVLSRPYTAAEGRTVIREMADQLSLELVSKGLLTDQIVLDVGYDVDNLRDPRRAAQFRGRTVLDFYGRRVPRPAHGSQNIGNFVSSSSRILKETSALYDSIVDPELLVRRFSLSFLHLAAGKETVPAKCFCQLDLFTDPAEEEKQRAIEQAAIEKERRMQETVLGIKSRFGKNAIVRGLNLRAESTAIERNRTIGGHKSGNPGGKNDGRKKNVRGYHRP